MSRRFQSTVPGRVLPAVMRGPATGQDLLLWTFNTIVVVFGAAFSKQQLVPSAGTMPVPFFRMEPDVNNLNPIYIGEADVSATNATAGNSKWITSLSPGEFFQAEQNDPWDSLEGAVTLPDGELISLGLDHAMQYVDITQFWGQNGGNNPPALGDLLYITIGQRTQRA